MASIDEWRSRIVTVARAAATGDRGPLDQLCKELVGMDEVLASRAHAVATPAVPLVDDLTRSRVNAHLTEMAAGGQPVPAQRHPARGK